MNFFQKLIYQAHTTTLQITSANGFHLRPVARFVSEAKGFNLEIKAFFKEKEADAKEAMEKLEGLFHQLMEGNKETEAIDKEEGQYEGRIIYGEIISRGVAIATACRY